ncbi:MAG: hypothetical protein RDU01_06255 [Thermodesulfovibrionales bacterium]|nr:hypothetical protein [Thermodesulfovibrionales bacterium]
MEKPKIRIFNSLARSGGTLVCKCIGCMSDVVLLSEIHPLSTQIFNPIAQAHDWYNLIHREDLLGKETIDFVEAIQLIERKCNENSKCLVIRDWSHLDFIGIPYLEQPTNRMVLIDELSSAFEFYRIALVRHPIDQWLSTHKLPGLKEVSLDNFLHGYLQFSRHIQPFGFVRYEDFTYEPEKEMIKICEQLKIDFDKNFTIKWTHYSNITGDTSSRGLTQNNIVRLPRQPIERQLLQKFRANNDYHEILYLLGYQDR